MWVIVYIEYGYGNEFTVPKVTGPYISMGEAMKNLDQSNNIYYIMEVTK